MEKTDKAEVVLAAQIAGANSGEEFWAEYEREAEKLKNTVGPHIEVTPRATKS